ncbi:unnamed protein product [Arabidopsis lyrata]|nr:unnamed protein product [Arabidopsis lyrata]
MDDRTYKLIGSDYPGNNPEDVIYPGLWWMTGFLFVVSFLGLFSLVPLRKGVSEVMILDYKLTYATATAMLINSFHYNTGAELAGGIGDACGFDHFPTLGLTLFKNTFYFDFSPTFIGCGMICPHLVNCSVLLGAIISWGFLWPFISQHAGDWYPTDIRSLSPLLSSLVTVSTTSLRSLLSLHFNCYNPIVIPTIEMVLCPLFILSCLGSRFLQFLWSWAHGYNGGVIAGLAACGIMMSIVSTVADLMQDFKTGYLTLSSAKSMFVTQLLGTAMGCIIAPVTFWLFWTAFDIGDPDGLYKAPYAVIYREMAILEIEGFAKLPKHCLTLCCRFFIAALIVNL